MHRNAPASCGGCGDRAALLCPGGGCGTLWLCWMEMRCLSFPRLGSGCTAARAGAQSRTPGVLWASLHDLLNIQGCFSPVTEGKEQNWKLLSVVFLFLFIPQSALCFVLCSSDLVRSPWLCWLGVLLLRLQLGRAVLGWRWQDSGM